MRQLLADMQLIKSIVLGNQNTQQPQLGPAPIYVTNVSGEEIPAYACMQCTGTEVIGNRTYIQVDQPADATGAAGGFLFNSPRAIAIDANGIGFAGPHVRALGDGSTATAGGRWGPAASSWEIEPDASGLFVVIGDDSVATDVVRTFTGIGGGVSLYRFTLNEDFVSGTADADILNMDGTDTGIDANVQDPLNIFSTIGNGDAGLCLLQNGSYYIIQAPCPEV
jgi:hypothetical protein